MSVDLDSPEHALCSAALDAAREELTARTEAWKRAVIRAVQAEAEVERFLWRTCWCIDAHEPTCRAWGGT